MNTRINKSIVALGAVAGLSTSAFGFIVSVTGQGVQIGAPASCVQGALVNFNAQCWNEQSGITSSALFVDMTNNPGASTSPIPGPIGGTFDSHFIHYEGIPGVINAVGTVTFSAAIKGVIFNAPTLNISDAPLGAGGTLYPTGYAFRGLLGAGPSFFSILGNTLSFNLNTLTPTQDVIQIRVLTDHVAPAPGAATALIGMGGLVGLRRRRA